MRSIYTHAASSTHYAARWLPPRAYHVVINRTTKLYSASAVQHSDCCYDVGENQTKESSLGSVHLKSVGGGAENGGGGGGGSMQIPYWILGGPSKFRIGFGGRGSCKFCMLGKKPVTLHFRIIIYLLNNQINYFIYPIRYFFVSVQYSTGTP